MKLWRFPVALAGALWLVSCGGSDRAPDRAWPAPSPALWEVTAPDGDKAWLFGTVHALPDGVAWRTPAFEAAFDDAELLVVEIAALGDTAQAFPIFQRLSVTDGLPQLSHRVTGPDRAVVEALLDQVDARESDYDAMESWAAAMVLAGGVRLGDPDNGVDRAVLDSGKPAEGLETFAQQFALFDALPQTEQNDLLVAVAHEATGSDPAAALEFWLEGDVGALEQLAQAGMLGDPELRAALLDGRNRAWLDRIVPLIDEGRQPFVAVGAAHMLGNGGLPALLAQRGFTVRRLQ